MPYLTLFLISCAVQGYDTGKIAPTKGGTSAALTDADGDGAVAADDCDDTNPAIHPGAGETCDSVDQDCDGEIDEDPADGTEWYPDLNGDGVGAVDGVAVLACTAPTNTAASNTDCDDADAGVYVGAPEICDDRDQDCDGEADDSPTAARDWFGDDDGDGYGTPNGLSVQACDAPDGAIDNDLDCDDANAEVSPAASEVCNLLDDDCDGATDEAGAEDESTWYQDSDADSFGDPAVAARACEQPAGYVGEATDCDDSAADVSPDQLEICNDRDDDCDGFLDEDVVGAPAWFADADGDSLGDPDDTQAACDAPVGYVGNPNDCDDQGVSVGGPSDWYDDLDTDGFGAGTPTAACSAPAGAVANASDCDDGDDAVSPIGIERCNTLDDDCDGAADEDGLDAAAWYADADADGFGDPAAPIYSCAAPTGYVADDTDCDDTSASTSPGAAESGLGAGENCDGQIDEDSAVDAPIWYADLDLDGYGDPDNVTAACLQPSGYLSDPTDCDDADADIHPGAEESCDDVDENCDGNVDEAVLHQLEWYLDVDDDGYGTTAVSYTGCDPISDQFVATATDCDDTDAGVSPGALERCGGGDEDCEGQTDEDDASDATAWYTDADNDGYGDPSTRRTACVEPLDVLDNGLDCDDADAGASPAELERCGGGDEDCDGVIDEDEAEDASTWYRDADGDGFGEDATALTQCAEAGVLLSGDCDDLDARLSPGAEDVCEDGVDQDCSGLDESCIPLPRGFFVESDADVVLTSTAGTQINAQNGDGFGVGDLNGDGHADLAAVVGGSTSVLPSRSVVYLVAGPITQNADIRDLDYAELYDTTPSYYYPEVVGIGDVLGTDSINDVLVRRGEGTATERWQLVLVPGDLSGPHSLADPASLGGVSVDWSANSGVYAADSELDWNDDGFLDLPVGSWGFTQAGVYTGDGQAAVILGPIDPTESSITVEDAAEWRVVSTDVSTAFGAAVAGADFDGDGSSELVVVASQASNPHYLLYLCTNGGGGVLTVTDACETEISGVDSHLSYFGYGLAIHSQGDLDADGLDDLVVSQYGTDSITYAFLDPLSGSATVGDADVTITHAGTYSSGFEVDSGDINADGADELLIAGPGGGTLEYGAVYLYSVLDAGTYTDEDAIAVYEGARGPGFGWWAGIVPDLGVDGIPDVLINGPGQPGSADVYLYASE